MDHLPLPDGTKPFIVAPYEAPETEWYKDEGFLSFPSSRGWTESELHGNAAGGFGDSKAGEKVEQFFQTWLFFGLAIDVLELGGVSACTDDFLKEKGHTKARIVDTSKLPVMLVKWEKGVKTRKNARGDWNTLSAMFDRAGGILDRFCRVPDEDECSLHDEIPIWPVRDEISTTIIALASTLRGAAINAVSDEIGSEIDSSAPWPVHARSIILKRRLEAKWCVADVTTMLKQLPIDGHYYVSASPGLEPEEVDHHAKCIQAHCLYEYDENLYTTKHVTDDNCPEDINHGGQLGPERGQKDWVDAISRIIDKGAIPIALWNKGWENLWSVEYHFSGKRRPDYVAISHVWADEKGNPNSNSLPQCQLHRIQSLIEKLTWPGRKPVPANPSHSDGVGFWMDTLCIPVNDKTRRDKAITTMRYVYSHAKAVLILDDWTQSIRSDAGPLDIITRVYLSNWIKRLWTHQEGFLPNRDSLWIQFADKAVEMNHLNDSLKEHVTSLQNQGIHLGFPMNANLRLLEQYTFFEWAFKDTAKDSKWKLYKPLANVMSERKTSRLADEVICLATIVDIPLEPILEIPSKPDAQSGQERMAKFILTLGRFDSGMIFNNYPRLEKRGYRWAPRSLLNLRTARITYWAKADYARDTNVPFREVDGQIGLLVRYPGFVIDIDWLPFARERRFAILIQYGGGFLVVRLSEQIEWTPGKYAVILPEMPERDQRVPAVVATVEQKAAGGIYTVRHECITSVSIQDAFPPLDIVEAVLLSDTKWLVV